MIFEMLPLIVMKQYVFTNNILVLEYFLITVVTAIYRSFYTMKIYFKYMMVMV